MVEFLENNIWLVIWFGALLTHWFSGGKGSNRARSYLKKLLPDRKKNLYYILDLIISPVLGAFFAFLTIGPTELTAAIISGATWHLALNRFIDIKTKND